MEGGFVLIAHTSERCRDMIYTNQREAQWVVMKAYAISRGKRSVRVQVWNKMHVEKCEQMHVENVNCARENHPSKMTCAGVEQT